MKPKKRKKWLYVLLVVAGLWTIGVIQMLVEKSNSPPPRKPAQAVKSVSKPSVPTTTSSSRVSKTSVKAWQPKPVIAFTKGFISLNAVKKHPKLKTETEQLAYWYRYNAVAAGVYHKLPKKSGEYNDKFKANQRVLGDQRFYEIMELADSDYHSHYNKTK